jgi:hypothetical protein
MAPALLTGRRRISDVTVVDVERTVSRHGTYGVILAARQLLRVGHAHAGNMIVVLKDTCLRVQHDD